MNSHIEDPEEEKGGAIIRRMLFPEEKQFAALVKEFSEAPTNEARMKVTANYYSVLGKDNYIEECFREVKTKTNFKDKVKSEQFRTKGNTQYRNGDNRKALELYTKSIAYAPQSSSGLHLAYANRSAVLRSMGKCRECLVDIERALSHGYPRDKSFKLLLREMQCHRDLDNSNAMNESFEKAVALLHSLPGMTEKEKAALKKQLDEEKQAPLKNVCNEVIIFPEEVPELSYGPNPEIVGASSAVRIEYNEQHGRHLVATRDINIGDVLLIGENIVGAVRDEHKYDHCSHCHKPCYNLLPCHNCVWMMFCSEQCQSEANEKYHLAECAAYSRFCSIHGKMFSSHSDRVIRLLAMIGINNLQPYFKYARTNTKKAWNSMSDEDKRTKGFDCNGVFDETNIDTIFNLVSMIEHHNQRDCLISSLSSLEIPRCFGLSMKDKDFYAIAGLCLQLLDTASLTSITKTCNSFKSTHTPPLVSIHSTFCFNPLNSLVNHACFSNLVANQYGNKIVRYARWPISKGSMLTESYGAVDLKCPKAERQKMMKSTYFFDCKCEACENDWQFKLDCIPNPADRKLMAELCQWNGQFIAHCHESLPKSQLTKLFETFTKNRYDFFTKMWEKCDFLDIRCYCLQSQLLFYEKLQGNRVVFPHKEFIETVQSFEHELDKELLTLFTDMIDLNN